MPLKSVDLSLSLDRKTYVTQTTRTQLQLRELSHQLYAKGRPLVVVYEGWDAAGKGGSIKRVTEKLDPRGFDVYPTSAPTGEEKTHHYLWRFWRHVPEGGKIAIFDRSWYGRVLVERVEGFCTKDEWRRAFREINAFESQLIDFGTIVVKFWMHISRDEQLHRFEERQKVGYKAWKLTAEDWRNREKWSLYEAAAEEMIIKTSTLQAPWTIVEGNDKWWARVKTLSSLVNTLAAGLDHQPADPLAIKNGKAVKGAGSANKKKGRGQ